MDQNICFVIQPFDKAGHDKRYIDILKPSIEECGLTPYRVDEDHEANNLIDTIENKIKTAKICIADISSDNPNVWYELGFAMASGKNNLLICQQKMRDKLPFDISHRKVIFYNTESESDFKDLKYKIVQRINALLKETKKQKIDNSSLSEFPSNELLNIYDDTKNKPSPISYNSQFAISFIFERSDDDHIISVIYFKNSLKEDLDFINADIKFLIIDLLNTGLITKILSNDSDSIPYEEPYNNSYESFQITEEGLTWCNENRKIISEMCRIKSKQELDDFIFKMSIDF